MVQGARPHLKKGAVIVNTTSVAAYRGSSERLDHSATKGAIVAFTRSLAQKLAGEGTRVKGMAPGPIWTPLIPATFPAENVKQFGANTRMKPPGQPNEVAPSYLFLASEDSSYTTGSVLHPNGGDPTEAGNKKGGSTEPPNSLLRCERCQRLRRTRTGTGLYEGVISTKSSMTAEREPPIRKRASAIST
jgi:enoyl-[acyl-carrier-protein] reductase (NADH)